MRSYNELIQSVRSLGKITYIGETVGGYPIPLVQVGEEPTLLAISSFHAREYITTYLTNNLVKKARSVSFHYLPMLNIDGVLLCREGLKSVADRERQEFLTEVNGGSRDFSQWKANLNAVDINVNFDADWGEGEQNVTSPSPANYIGKYPNSEPETQAVVNLLKNYDYPMLSCYHCCGEVIYWGYEDNFLHYAEAKRVADKLGYRLTRSENSSGGCKDYYAQNYKGLGLTIEVGEDGTRHPYPISGLDRLTLRHANSIELQCKIGGEIAKRIYGAGL